MTGAIVNFDQSVWGAAAAGMPVPAAPMSRPRINPPEPRLERDMSVGVGVIGTGVMGSEHARLLRGETPGAHLAGVFDADPDRAQAAAVGAAVFSDPRSLIASDQIEAVIIASPDATHAELTLACLEAGKPVFAKSRWLPRRRKLCAWCRRKSR